MFFYNKNVLLHVCGKGEDFPGSPVAETPCSQCRGPGFDATRGSHAATKDFMCHN